MKKLIIAISVALVLGACSKTESVEYYASHPDELNATLSKCEKLSSEEQNCSNAKRASVFPAAAKADIQSIKTALKLYKLDNKAYPTQQQGLDALVNKPSVAPIPNNYKASGYLEKLPKDPWGNDYQYQNPGKHGEVDIYSYGAGGISSGEEGQTVIGDWN